MVKHPIIVTSLSFISPNVRNAQTNRPSTAVSGPNKAYMQACPSRIFLGREIADDPKIPIVQLQTIRARPGPIFQLQTIRARPDPIFQLQTKSVQP